MKARIIPERGEIFLETVLFVPFLLGLGLLGLDYGIALYNRAQTASLVSSALQSATSEYPSLENEEIAARSEVVVQKATARLRDALGAEDQALNVKLDVRFVWLESAETAPIAGFYRSEYEIDKARMRPALRIVVDAESKGLFGSGHLFPLPPVHEDQLRFLRSSSR